MEPTPVSVNTQMQTHASTNPVALWSTLPDELHQMIVHSFFDGTQRSSMTADTLAFRCLCKAFVGEDTRLYHFLMQQKSASLLGSRDQILADPVMYTIAVVKWVVHETTTGNCELSVGSYSLITNRVYWASTRHHSGCLGGAQEVFYDSLTWKAAEIIADSNISTECEKRVLKILQGLFNYVQKHYAARKALDNIDTIIQRDLNRFWAAATP